VRRFAGLDLELKETDKQQLALPNHQQGDLLTRLMALKHVAGLTKSKKERRYLKPKEEADLTTTVLSMFTLFVMLVLCSMYRQGLA
jgi:hypothetical protein